MVQQPLWVLVIRLLPFLKLQVFKSGLSNCCPGTVCRVMYSPWAPTQAATPFFSLAAAAGGVYRLFPLHQLLLLAPAPGSGVVQLIGMQG